MISRWNVLNARPNLKNTKSVNLNLENYLKQSIYVLGVKPKSFIATELITQPNTSQTSAVLADAMVTSTLNKLCAFTWSRAQRLACAVAAESLSTKMTRSRIYIRTRMRRILRNCKLTSPSSRPLSWS